MKLEDVTVYRSFLRPSEPARQAEVHSLSIRSCAQPSVFPSADRCVSARFSRPPGFLQSGTVASVILILCFLAFVLLATLYGLVFVLSTDIPPFRIIVKTLWRDVRAAYLYFKVVAFGKKCHLHNHTLVDYFQKTLEKYRHKACFVFEDEEWTYEQVNEFSDKIAHVFIQQGLCKGDEVALIMENCPEYACIWLGLCKIGVVTAFINTNLRTESLGHSVNVIDAKAIIYGECFSEAVKGSESFLKKKDTLQYYSYSRGDTSPNISFPEKSLNRLLAEASIPSASALKNNRPGFKNKAFYVYTSGSTGLPKAAIIRHSRAIFLSSGPFIMSQLGEYETVYDPLPMYHSAGGLMFVVAIIMFGGKMILRKKFSASNFWKEAIKHKATVAQYIGEICRYLLNQPVTPEETQHSVRIMFGNGLRPHLWKEFQNRFGIKRIIELYGATEGNANLVNMFGKEGAVGFVPRVCNRLYPVYLIKTNPETGEPLRNEKGLCIRCKIGEPGELVGKILLNNPVNSFDGYANREETKKKVISDCFSKGDIAFLSGDILVMDEEGYLYFMDRTGDTFRWRGENVSTSEVENVVSKAMGHVSCVVYGVEIPNVEGRAGMAVLQADAEKANFPELFQKLHRQLPPYAVPLFIRMSLNIESTGTYKLRKVNLQKEGYNPEDIPDPLLYLDAKNKTYVPLTKQLYLDILNGKIKL